MSGSVQSSAVNLDINDLVNAVKIIDFAFDQGIFKGVESIRGVLQVRDRLTTFLESIPKPANAEEKDTESVSEKLPPSPKKLKKS